MSATLMALLVSVSSGRAVVVLASATPGISFTTTWMVKDFLKPQIAAVRGTDANRVAGLGLEVKTGRTQQFIVRDAERVVVGITRSADQAVREKILWIGVACG